MRSANTFGEIVFTLCESIFILLVILGFAVVIYAICRYIYLSYLICKVDDLKQENTISFEDEIQLEQLSKQFDNVGSKENYNAYKQKLKEVLARSK